MSSQESSQPSDRGLYPSVEVQVAGPLVKDYQDCMEKFKEIEECIEKGRTESNGESHKYEVTEALRSTLPVYLQEVAQRLLNGLVAQLQPVHGGRDRVDNSSLKRALEVLHECQQRLFVHVLEMRFEEQLYYAFMVHFMSKSLVEYQSSLEQVQSSLEVHMLVALLLGMGGDSAEKGSCEQLVGDDVLSVVVPAFGSMVLEHGIVLVQNPTIMKAFQKTELYFQYEEWLKRALEHSKQSLAKDKILKIVAVHALPPETSCLSSELKKKLQEEDRDSTEDLVMEALDYIDDTVCFGRQEEDRDSTEDLVMEALDYIDDTECFGRELTEKQHEEEEKVGTVKNQKILLKALLHSMYQDTRMNISSFSFFDGISPSTEGGLTSSGSGKAALLKAMLKDDWEMMTLLLKEGFSSFSKSIDKLLVREDRDGAKLIVSEEVALTTNVIVGSSTGPDLRYFDTSQTSIEEEFVSFEKGEPTKVHVKELGKDTWLYIISRQLTAATRSEQQGTLDESLLLLWPEGLPPFHPPHPPPPPTLWCWKRLLESVDNTYHYIASADQEALEQLDTECQETICHAVASDCRTQPTLIRLLLEKVSCSLPGVQDKHGNTPLHNAVLSGNVMVVRILATLHSSAIQTQNFERHTPLDVAVSNRNDEVVECLLRQCLRSDPHSTSNVQLLQSCLLKAMKTGYTSFLKMFLQLRSEYRLVIDFECTDSEGCSAWHYLTQTAPAVRAGAVELLKASDLGQPLLTKLQKILNVYPHQEETTSAAKSVQEQTDVPASLNAHTTSSKHTPSTEKGTASTETKTKHTPLSDSESQTDIHVTLPDKEMSHKTSDSLEHESAATPLEGSASPPSEQLPTQCREESSSAGLSVLEFTNSCNPLDVTHSHMNTYRKCCPRHDIRNIFTICPTCPPSDAFGPKRRYSSIKDIQSDPSHSEFDGFKELSVQSSASRHYRESKSHQVMFERSNPESLLRPNRGSLLPKLLPQITQTHTETEPHSFLPHSSKQPTSQLHSSIPHSRVSEATVAIATREPSVYWPYTDSVTSSACNSPPPRKRSVPHCRLRQRARASRRLLKYRLTSSGSDTAKGKGRKSHRKLQKRVRRWTSGSESYTEPDVSVDSSEESSSDSGLVSDEQQIEATREMDRIKVLQDITIQSNTVLPTQQGQLSWPGRINLCWLSLDSEPSNDERRIEAANRMNCIEDFQDLGSFTQQVPRSLFGMVFQLPRCRELSCKCTSVDFFSPSSFCTMQSSKISFDANKLKTWISSAIHKSSYDLLKEMVPQQYHVVFGFDALPRKKLPKLQKKFVRVVASVVLDQTKCNSIPENVSKNVQELFSSSGFSEFCTDGRGCRGKRQKLQKKDVLQTGNLKTRTLKALPAGAEGESAATPLEGCASPPSEQLPTQCREESSSAGLSVLEFTNSCSPLDVIHSHLSTYRKCCPRHDIRNILTICQTCPPSDAFGPKRRYSSIKDIQSDPSHSEFDGFKELSVQSSASRHYRESKSHQVMFERPNPESLLRPNRGALLPKLLPQITQTHTETEPHSFLPHSSKQPTSQLHSSIPHSRISEATVATTTREPSVETRPKHPEPSTRLETPPTSSRNSSIPSHQHTSLLDSHAVPQDHKERLRSSAELLHAQDYNRILPLAYEGEPPASLPPELKIPYVFVTGLAYYKLSNHKKSVQYFSRCLRLADECGRDGDVTICNIYLGDVEFAKRRYPEAAGRYRTALHHYSRDSVAKDFRMVMPTQSAVWLKCGSAFKNASRVGDSVAAYEKAVELATAHSSKKDQLSAHTSLGNLYQGIGENGRAVKEYEAAIKLAEDLKDNVSLGWNHGNLGNALLGLHQRDKALHHLFKALDMAVEYETTPQAIGRAFNNLGTAFQSLNELSKAEEHYDFALAQAIYGNDIPGQARVYGNILQMFSKQYEKAVSHYTKVIHASSSEDDSKSYFKVSLHGPDFGHCEDVLVTPDVQKYYLQGTRDLEYVIKHHEESFNGIKGSPKGLSLSVSLFETNSRTFHRMQDCLVYLQEEDSSHRPRQTRFKEPRQTRFEDAPVVAEQSRARTLGELLLKRRGLQLEHELVSPPSLDQMKAIVGRQSCPVIYLSYTGERLLGWLLYPTSNSKSSVNMFEIPLSDNEFDGKSLDYHLRYSLNEQLVEKSFEMYKPFDHEKEKTEPLEKLYDLVARPVMAMISTLDKAQKEKEGASQHHKRDPEKKERVRKIVVVPDSYTNLLPFTCVLNRDTGKFWGDESYFQIMPSLLTMGILDQLPTVSVAIPVEFQQMLCVVGNPNIPRFTYNGEDWDVGKLPHATREAEWVSHILQCNPILHEQATKDAVLMRIMNAKVIHLATHGSAVAGFLAFAGISSSSSEAVDAKKVLIYPEEVESLNISPALVVLGSCDSGRGVFKADGIQGMARAFILAGAQAVLSPQTPSANEVTQVESQHGSPPPRKPSVSERRRRQRRRAESRIYEYRLSTASESDSKECSKRRPRQRKETGRRCATSASYFDSETLSNEEGITSSAISSPNECDHPMLTHNCMGGKKTVVLPKYSIPLSVLGSIDSPDVPLNKDRVTKEMSTEEVPTQEVEPEEEKKDIHADTKKNHMVTPQISSITAKLQILEYHESISVVNVCLYHKDGDYYIKIDAYVSPGLKDESELCKTFEQKLSTLRTRRFKKVVVVIDVQLDPFLIINIHPHLLKHFYFQVIPYPPTVIEPEVPYCISFSLCTGEHACVVGNPSRPRVEINGNVQELPDLPAAAKEAKFVSEWFRCEPLIGKNATKEALMKMLPHANFVHIAAHCGDRGLVLTDKQMLTPGDILNLKFRNNPPYLVVLNCCDTAKAAGGHGIAQAFLKAGVTAVITVYGKIENDAAYQFSKYFYQSMKAGSVGTWSLHEALMKLYNSNSDSRSCHVYFGKDVKLT